MKGHGIESMRKRHGISFLYKYIQMIQGVSQNRIKVEKDVFSCDKSSVKTDQKKFLKERLVCAQA